MSISTIFDNDEMKMNKVDKNWGPEDLLAQDGLFFLKDVVKVFNLKTSTVKRKFHEIKDLGQDPYLVMGVRKVWQHWLVRMKVFAPYYRHHLDSKVQPLSPDWDANLMLKQSGIFLLGDVVERLPFTSHQLRHQANHCGDPRKEMGVWKDNNLKLFVVDMQAFAPWVRKTWNGDFSRTETT